MNCSASVCSCLRLLNILGRLITLLTKKDRNNKQKHFLKKRNAMWGMNDCDVAGKKDVNKVGMSSYYTLFVFS